MFYLHKHPLVTTSHLTHFQHFDFSLVFVFLFKASITTQQPLL